MSVGYAEDSNAFICRVSGVRVQKRICREVTPCWRVKKIRNFKFFCLAFVTSGTVKGCYSNITSTFERQLLYSDLISDIVSLYRE